MSLYLSKTNQPKDCMFCETPNAQIGSGTSDGSAFNCPICGKYMISRTQQATLSFRDSVHEEKLQIAQLLAERHLLAGDQKYFFEINSVEELLKQYPRDILERLDRALINLSRKITDPYDEICFFSESIVNVQYFTDFSGEQEFVRIVLLLFASKKTNAHVALDIMVQNGWLRMNKGSNTNDYAISSKGWEHIRELKKRPAGDTKQAFIAMWFNKERDKYYFDGIEKACLETGYVPLRIDLKQHNEKICDEIIAEIRKSRILIADTTGNRGGVYFEAGFAMGLGLPVIYLFDKGYFDKDGPHFDTNHYNHIVYEDEKDLFTQLKNRILATVPLDK